MSVLGMSQEIYRLVKDHLPEKSAQVNKTTVYSKSQAPTMNSFTNSTNDLHNKKRSQSNHSSNTSTHNVMEYFKEKFSQPADNVLVFNKHRRKHQRERLNFYKGSNVPRRLRQEVVLIITVLCILPLISRGLEARKLLQAKLNKNVELNEIFLSFSYSAHILTYKGIMFNKKKPHNSEGYQRNIFCSFLGKNLI